MSVCCFFCERLFWVYFLFGISNILELRSLKRSFFIFCWLYRDIFCCGDGLMVEFFGGGFIEIRGKLFISLFLVNDVVKLYKVFGNFSDLWL